MFVPLLQPPGTSAGPSLVISVRGSAVALHDADEPDVGDAIFLGTLAGRHCWAVDADADPANDDGGHADLFRLFGMVDDTRWALAGRAVQLVEWQRTHRFCGRCGVATVEAPGERARRCPTCSLLSFPRLVPAVIALVEHDDGRALLARNARWPTTMFSCLAGFVEPGETLEAAVRREVGEEVGIEVGEVRYWGSQAWPFPHSMMIGFRATYLDGDITCDGEEIAEADWFRPDELPGVPPPMSIARWLIDDWATGATR